MYRFEFLLSLKTYNANGGRSDGPTKFPPSHWIVANHVLNSIVETIHTKSPRDRDAFEENEEQQTETTDRIRVQNLENVHAALNCKYNAPQTNIIFICR